MEQPCILSMTENTNMKNPIEHLNKAFDNRVRLGIMSALVVNEFLNFKSLKSLLKVTDGNLASHISGLEKIEFVRVQKSFKNKKPNTEYSITPEGKLAFQSHLDALALILKNSSM